MTVAEHQRAADAELAVAADQEAHFDPRAAQTMYVGPSFGMPAHAGAPVELTTVNPTLRYDYDAKRHARIAAREDQAAETLLATEEETCAPYSVAVRASCPAVHVANVRRTMGGVRATLADRTDAAELTARLRCHIAYADAFGETEGACAVYQRGERVDEKNGVLVFRAPKRDERAALYAFLSR